MKMLRKLPCDWQFCNNGGVAARYTVDLSEVITMGPNGVPLQCRHGRERGVDVINIKRFEKKTIGSSGVRLMSQRGSGHQHHRKTRPLPFHLLENEEAILAGHIDITQHDITRLLLQDVQGLSCRFGRDHMDAWECPLKQSLYEHQDGRLVVNQEYT